MQKRIFSFAKENKSLFVWLLTLGLIVKAIINIAYICSNYTALTFSYFLLSGEMKEIYFISNLIFWVGSIGTVISVVASFKNQ